MAPSKFEARLAVLEREVARLTAKVEGTAPEETRWSERVAVTFADDPAHASAMKLGREYRASLRPKKSRTGND